MHHLGKIVEVQTEDGLRLHGFLQTATATKIETDLVDRPFAWIIVHGVAGNFYNSSLLASIADSLLAIGHDVLRINTRGRDPIAYIASAGGSSRIGAAYESIADCKLDLSAWIARLRGSGYQRVGLLGHSLGAIKAVVYASEPDSMSIEGLVCLSPPRLETGVLSTDAKYSAGYAENLQRATECVQQGKPETLLAVRFPQPMLISAATFLDKYGQDDLYDFVRLAARITVPSLWCFGDLEVRGDRASFRNSDQALEQALKSTSGHTLAIVEQADHAYTLARPELQAVIARWISEKI